VKRAGEAWERFLFAPRSVAPVVLIRVAFAVVAFAWTLSLLPDLDDFFSTGGLMSAPGPFVLQRWSVFALSGASWFVHLAWAVLLAGCVALAIGWRTRFAAAVVFVLVTSFQRRNGFVFNAGDGALRILAFYMLLLPAGAAVSVDAVRARRSPWAYPERAPWALRLVQLQLSIVYLATVLEKLRGETWVHGTAVGYTVQIDDVARFPLPFVGGSPVLAGVFTYVTLMTEIAVGVGVWVPRLRRWVLLAGVGLHLGIEYSLRVGFFTAAMLVMYLSFVPPDAAERVVRAGRKAREKIPRRDRRLV
jgi:hypothetical protein